MRAYYLPMCAGFLLAGSAFMPWILIGDNAFGGLPSISGFWVLALAIVVVVLASLSGEAADELHKQSGAFLAAAPGVVVVDKRVDEGYVTPEESAPEEDVYVSRIPRDPTVENGLAMWGVSDNLRKGAALNTVQIAEELIKRHLQKKAS